MKLLLLALFLLNISYAQDQYADLPIVECSGTNKEHLEIREGGNSTIAGYKKIRVDVSIPKVSDRVYKVDIKNQDYKKLLAGKLLNIELGELSGTPVSRNIFVKATSRFDNESGDNSVLILNGFYHLLACSIYEN